MKQRDRNLFIVFISLLLLIITSFLVYVLIPEPSHSSAPYHYEEGDEIVEIEETPAPQLPQHQQSVGTAPVEKPAPVEEYAGTVYFVIDDAGYSLSQIKPFIDFPGKLTVAVLPRLQYSREVAELASKAGQAVILHQPMESVNGNDAGEGAIKVGMKPEEIITVLNENLAGIPNAIGFNNHMGSKGTADNELMHEVLRFAKKEGLVFLDSRTTAETVAPEIAEKLSMKVLQRNVFLDNSRKREDILEVLKKAFQLARKQGYVICIGHAGTEELGKILNEYYAEWTDLGFRFGAVNDFFEKEIP